MVTLRLTEVYQNIPFSKSKSVNLCTLEKIVKKH